MEPEDKLDRWLDRELTNAGSASPRSGFEQRLLANLAAQPRERHWQWRWLWVVGPALAAALIVVFYPTRPTPKPVTNVAKVAAPVVQPAPPVAKINGTPVNAVPRVRPRAAKVLTAKTRHVREPRLATFPSPDSNDQLVRLAVRFAQAHPEVAREIAEEQQRFREVAASFTEPLAGKEK